MASEGRGFVALFPGQGSQAVGMGRELHEGSKAAREIFERADEALSEPISRLCFEGPEDDLRLTRNTQPALLTVSIAALSCWRERGGPEPLVAAGHSLGEYSALVAAGVLSFEDAVRAVRVRGEAMQEAVPVGVGAMAAVVGLEPEALEALCAEVAGADEVLVPANVNAPDQIVVAGHASAVERLAEVAPGRGAKRVVALPVSAPFHSPLMQPAALRLGEFLAGLNFSDARFPVVANVDAASVREGAEAREKLLRQVASPVLWVSGMKAIETHFAVERGFEFGAGRVLAGLARRITRAFRVSAAGTPEEIEQGLEALGQQEEGGS